MTSPETSSRIERALRLAFSPEHLAIVDESAAHAGHAGARGGKSHVAVILVSARFQGLGLVARHRMVHAALADEMRESIHALALGAYTPQEWDDPAVRLRRVSTLG